MGKITETAVRHHSQVGRDISPSAKSSKAADPVILAGKSFNNPTAYLEKVGFDQGKYRQVSLNFKYAGASAKAGVTGVSAASSPSELLKNPRVRALLDTIAFAEGTRGNGDYGRVVNGTVIGAANPKLPFDRSLVGKRNVTVSDLRHHPNLLVQVAPGLRSSAAGRYQFLNKTWRGLGMKDFSPRSQDLAAIKLMQGRGMITPLLRGDFNTAIHKGAPEWASLPTASGGSFYGGQGAKSLSSLRSAYATALRKYQRILPTSPSAPTTPETLKRGSHGHAVEVLQNRLINLGTMTAAQKRTGAGIFGPRTEKAVRNFQTKHNLKVTGIVDAKTFRAMMNAKPGKIQPSPNGGKAPTYTRWNVYSTGDSAARLADGYEDLQSHHGSGATTTNYVTRGLTLTHNLQKRDIVLTRNGQSNFGQAVPSPIKGKIVFAGNEGDGYGNKVVIKDFKTGQVILVGHLDSVNIKRGENIAYGQKLGGQGSTGNSTGAHIHVNADPSVIKRWVADLADGKFDGVRGRFDVGQRA